MNHNLSRLFYISGDEKNIASVKDIKFNKKLNDFNINASSFASYNNYYIANANAQFELTTVYPGLLLGAGYSHPALYEIKKDNKNDVSDFQLGFFFDHTTGLPVLPGSSVKGVLKSVFPKKDFSYKSEKLEYIKSLTVNALRNRNAVNQDVQLIDEINWNEIFFGSVKSKRKHIFFDAYVSEVKSGCNLFEDDYITPHGDDIFKNPTPIRFLKVGPGVKFTFQFKLVDYKDDGWELKAEDIKKVFRQILLDFGIGAKRNVGYGQFIDSKVKQ